MSIEPHDGPRGRTYRVRVDTVDDRGRRKQGMSTFRRKKDAEAFEATWTVKKRAGGATLVEPSRLTVAEVVGSWLESKRHELDDTQIANMSRIVNKHVLPTLGQIPVQKLKAHQIQLFLDAKRGSFPDGHGARTIELYYRHLSQALKFATMHRWVEQNEAARLKAPVMRPKRHQPWTVEQLGHFLNVADQRTLGPLFLVGAATGMRRGEVLGLRWTDVHWEKWLFCLRSKHVPIRPDRQRM